MEENLVYPFSGAAEAGDYIDCIWFKNDKFMPAVLEVEHTTGITSGLTRMLNFKTKLPNINTRYVVVASDDDRDKAITEIKKTMFSQLKACYLPYSAVEELYYLCTRRNIKGITEEFLDCYLENVA